MSNIFLNTCDGTVEFFTPVVSVTWHDGAWQELFWYADLMLKNNFLLFNVKNCFWLFNICENCDHFLILLKCSVYKS